MPLNLDAYLGVHQDALKLYAQRTSVLANNIANADTPNYKAQDIDFRAVLAGTAGAGANALPLATTNGAHVAGSSSATAAAATVTRTAATIAAASRERPLRCSAPV